MADIALRVRVTGRVQGVWFRGWTQAEASALGLSGWVRNEADGSVSALITGPEDKVAQMVRALHRGPELARVAAVESEEVAERAEGPFRVLR
ncbi:acylphosphatase [Pseudoruegeria sp. HB172150]|uniref:acylphosphatase n=1 Tax=Pseudoruegeria sp. HB172150 TaxID=2721164 RepID=UPI001554D87E|nr:acylphosphatase [Pseudoruegeria sp. HB172150]